MIFLNRIDDLKQVMFPFPSLSQECIITGRLCINAETEHKQNIINVTFYYQYPAAA